jgi:hypothetical protein
MPEDITVTITRRSGKEPSRYITDDMEDARRVFDERVAEYSDSESHTGWCSRISKVELWVGNRLVRFADKEGVFDVKYTRARSEEEFKKNTDFGNLFDEMGMW